MDSLDWYLKLGLLAAQVMTAFQAARVFFYLMEDPDDQAGQVKNRDRKSAWAGSVFLASMFCLTHLLVFVNVTGWSVAVNAGVVLLAIRILESIGFPPRSSE